MLKVSRLDTDISLPTKELQTRIYKMVDVITVRVVGGIDRISALFRVPSVVAMRPRQRRRERTEQEVDGDGNDDIVVYPNQAVQYAVSYAHSY